MYRHNALRRTGPDDASWWIDLLNGGFYTQTKRLPSVCRLQTVPSGASMRISSRVRTGAFSSMSIVGILFSLLTGCYRLTLLPGCIRHPARYYRDPLGARPRTSEHAVG